MLLKVSKKIREANEICYFRKVFKYLKSLCGFCLILIQLFLMIRERLPELSVSLKFYELYGTFVNVSELFYSVIQYGLNLQFFVHEITKHRI